MAKIIEEKRQKEDTNSQMRLYEYAKKLAMQ